MGELDRLAEENRRLCAEVQHLRQQGRIVEAERDAALEQSDAARLRRALRTARAFERALVCLMRRVPRDDTRRRLAARLIERRAAHGRRLPRRPSDPFDLETEP